MTKIIYLLSGAIAASVFSLYFRAFSTVTSQTLFHTPFLFLILIIEAACGFYLYSHIENAFGEDRAVSMSLGLASLALPFSVFLILLTRTVLGIPRFETLPWYALTVYPAVILLPVSFSLGVLFFSVSQKGIRNSAVFGALLFLLFDCIYLWSLEIVTVSIITSALGILLLFYFSKTLLFRYFFLTVSVVLMALIFYEVQEPLIVLQRAYTRGPAEHIKSSLSAYGYQGIYRFNSGEVLSLNHTPVVQPSNHRHSEEIVHFAMLQHIKASKVLLIGDWPEAVREVLRYPDIQTVIWAPPLPLATETASLGYLNDGRVRVLRDHDPRLFVRNIGGEAFDAVIISLTDPTNIFLNRYYSIEFFHELKTILSPHSIVAVSLLLDEQGFGYNRLLLNQSVLNSIKRIFPNMLLIPRGAPLVLASYERNFTRASEDLSESLREIYGSPLYVTPPNIRFRMNAATPWYEERSSSRLNQDFRPATLKYSFNELLFSMGMLSPRIIDFTENLPSIAINTTFLILMLLAGVLLKNTSFSNKLQIARALSYFTITIFLYSIFISVQIYSGQLFRLFTLVLFISAIGLIVSDRGRTRRNGRGSHLRARGVLFLSAIYYTMVPSVFELSISPPGLDTLMLIAFFGVLISGSAVSQLKYSIIYENNGEIDCLSDGRYIFSVLICAALASILIIPVTGIIDMMPLLGIISLGGVFLINI